MLIFILSKVAICPVFPRHVLFVRAKNYVQADYFNLATVANHQGKHCNHCLPYLLYLYLPHLLYV